MRSSIARGAKRIRHLLSLALPVDQLHGAFVISRAQRHLRGTKAVLKRARIGGSTSSATIKLIKETAIVSPFP